ARIYAPGNTLLKAGETLRQPALEKALALLAEEGAGSVYRGSLAQALLSLMRQRGGVVTAEDLASYEARWSDPREVGYSRTRVLTRGGLAALADVLPRLPPQRGVGATERVLSLLPFLEL